MPYTFKPKEKYAKSHGSNVRISRKDAIIICRVIRKKPLTRAKRLLNDLSTGKRSLEGKYYTKAVKEIKNLLDSCEKNVDFLGLDKERLIVHASASQGAITRRRRRKAAFGSRIKSTNVEIMLLEKGKIKEKPKKEVKKKEKKKVKVEKKETEPKGKAEAKLEQKKESKEKTKEESEPEKKESKKEEKKDEAVSSSLPEKEKS